ncbi:MAG: hypothetical protein M9887_01650 [Chitinophagales bacterium]|nr:hypothetical protein [Chitinophagales bacterium]
MEEKELEINNQEESQSGMKETLKTLSIVFKRCKRLFKEHYLRFIIIAIVCLGVAIYFFFNREIEYKGSVLFVLQDENMQQGVSTSVDPLSAYLLTSYATQGLTVDQLKEIGLSQKLMSNLLFNKCVVKGRNDYLINQIIIEYYGSDKPYFKAFRNLSSLTRSQYSVFMRISSLLRSKLEITQRKSGAYSISLSLKNEELAKVTLELLYQNISNFYIDKTTEKAQANYIFLRNRVDSVRNMLYSSEYQVASFEDRSKNLLLYTARIPQLRQQRNTEFYQMLYSDLIKKFETSKVTINNITPIFQLLQRPYYPLIIITTSKLLILIINMAICLFLMLIVIAYLYIKKYIWPEYKDAFDSDDETELADKDLLDESS